MMSKLRLAAAIVVIGFGVSCIDGTGPPVDSSPEPVGRTDAEMHMLRQATVFPSIPDRGVLAEAAGSAQPLEAYDVSFWAIAGQSSSLSLNYVDGSPFLTVEVGQNSLLQYPDGQVFQNGDSVLIRVTADSALILIDLDPSGLVFDAQDPVLLHLAYSQADPDFNGDGVVDAADGQIESTSLGLWVQQADGDPWYPNDADHSLVHKSFTGYLHHFSNYTLSW